MVTESIKLTADDFHYAYWEKDSAGPELFELIIYGKSELHCNEIKQQILENQEIVNMIKIFYDLESNTWYPEQSMDNLNQKIREITGKDIKDLS